MKKFIWGQLKVTETWSNSPIRIYFPGLTLTGLTRLNIVDNSFPELSKSRIRVRQYVGSVPISVKNGNNSVSVVTLIDSIKIIPHSSWTGGNLPLRGFDSFSNDASFWLVDADRVNRERYLQSAPIKKLIRTFLRGMKGKKYEDCHEPMI